ncbi:MAG: hypothetical protein OEZ06_21230 [Myxococcales bacterium]|nr:hypothetical protein [Myxococcales bacterium]
MTWGSDLATGAVGAAALCFALGCSDGADAGAPRGFGATSDTTGTEGSFGFGNTGPAPVGTGTGTDFTGANGAAQMAGAAPLDTVPPPLPQESELRLDFELPQASQRFVYAANPGSGTVSIIDAESLAIQTLETGERPTFLKALANTDDAIVLNAGSDDATIMRDPAGGVKSTTVPVVDGANAIAVAPDGKHAVAYFNSEFSSAGSSSGSFQDVTLITLTAGGDSAVDMTVGFRPRDVFFAEDGSEAYVVTEDGVSVLNFLDIEEKGTGIARLVSLGQSADQRSLDVSVTSDGRFALARQPGESSIRLVSLQGSGAGEATALDLAELVPDAGSGGDADAGVPTAPAAVTDLDLAPNGKFALAVLRGQSALLRIPVPGGFEDPELVGATVIEDELIGSVEIAPASDLALLYTTAVPIERVTIAALEGDAETRTVALRKAVEAIAFAPDGKTALIMHSKAEGNPFEPGIDPDLQIDRSFGYSVLRTLSGDVKLQVTDTPPGAFSLVPDGSHVFVLFRDDASGLRDVHSVETKSFLVEIVSLGSPPISVGSVPDRKRVFVGQDHPDGRITFIDWETGQRQTVTGFELNSRIRD